MKYKEFTELYFGILLLVLGWGKRQYSLGFSLFRVQLCWHYENSFVDNNNLSEVSLPSSKLPQFDILELPTILVLLCSTSVVLCHQLWSFASFITVSPSTLSCYSVYILSVSLEQFLYYHYKRSIKTLYCGSLLVYLSP